jgi:hypothetical protein
MIGWPTSETYTRAAGGGPQARDAVNRGVRGRRDRAAGTGDLRAEFEDQARVLAAVGVDLMLAEYVGSIADCVTAVEACATVGLPVWLGVRHITPAGLMQYGERLEDLAEALRGRPAAAILLMCSQPEAISAGLPRLRAAFAGPIGGYANIGYRKNPNFGAVAGGQWHMIDQATYPPARYAEFARGGRRSGCRSSAAAARRAEHIAPAAGGQEGGAAGRVAAPARPAWHAPRAGRRAGGLPHRLPRPGSTVSAAIRPDCSIPSPARRYRQHTSPSSTNGRARMPSTSGDGVMYSTQRVRRRHRNCRSAASPMPVLKPCGTSSTWWSWAIQPIRRPSDSPPTLVTSGWTMSRAPRSSQGRKLCRRVSTSPLLINSRAPRRNSRWPSISSGGSASSNHTTP